MTSTVIFGSSDDLIEIRGVLDEEFSVDSDEPVLIGLSNGWLIRATYGARHDGCWRFEVIDEHGTSSELTIGPARGDEADAYEVTVGDATVEVPGYSGYVLVEMPWGPGLRWVSVGTNVART